MGEGDGGLVGEDGGWGSCCCLFPSVFLKDTAVLFHPAMPSKKRRTRPLAQRLLSWARTVCNNCITVQPQWLMNNKIIIPIHAVIKWDWLYLPVCSHWARSSIIIQCRCVTVCPTMCVCVYVFWGDGGVKSHCGACEDKQSQREENDRNQLKHYCPLYSRLIRSSQGTGWVGGLY